MKYTKTYIIILLSFNSMISQDITYNKDVKPIIDNHCITCHSKGNIGPINLSTFKAVRSSAQMMQYVIKEGIMPPWKVKSSLSFKLENKLSSKEILTIKNWIAQGMIEGDVQKFKADQVVHLPHDSTCVVFAMEHPFGPKTDYKLRSQVFVIPNQSDSTLYINALEFIPSNRSIVRSCVISLDTTNKAIVLDRKDKSYGYVGSGGIFFEPTVPLWHYWTPDQGVSILDFNVVKVIPPRCNLLFHITYTPLRKGQRDSSYLIVRLDPAGRKKSQIQTKNLINPELLGSPFILNPGDYRKIKTTYKLNTDIDLLSISPIGQTICVAWEVSIIRSNGIRIELLKINTWDFMWKRKYDLLKPLSLHKGDEIEAIATYDNTLENDYRSTIRPRKIVLGETMVKEMYAVNFDYIINKN